jgi:hypothetical protein
MSFHEFPPFEKKGYNTTKQVALTLEVQESAPLNTKPATVYRLGANFKTRGFEVSPNKERYISPITR